MVNRKTHVLFVCLGNICRSTMAEALFNNLLKKNNLQSEIQVDSAGTSNEEEGNPPNIKAQKVMDKHNLDYSHIISRPINDNDFKWADYIIGMSGDNIKALKKLAPAEAKNKIYLCMNILPEKKDEDIKDPWYTNKFDETYKSLSQSLPKWLDFIANKRSKQKG